MEIASIVFGNLEVEERALLRFAKGLYGLETLTEFALLRPDESLPFAYLQSKADSSVCLMVADPFFFHPAYEFALSEQDRILLGEPDPAELQIWVTVTTLEEMEQSTMNLLAPIVVNVTNKAACQLVLHNSSYQTRTPMFAKKEEE